MHHVICPSCDIPSVTVIWFFTSVIIRHPPHPLLPFALRDARTSAPLAGLGPHDLRSRLSGRAAGTVAVPRPPSPN